MVVVEEVGLIICESGVVFAKGQTPHSAKCTRDLAPMKFTWKRKGYKSRFEQKTKIGETHGREQGGEKEKTNNHSST